MSTRTLAWTVGGALAAGLTLAAGAAGGPERVASIEEAQEVAAERSRTMKGLGRSMRTLKGFAGGRGSAEDAAAAAAAVAAAAPRIPSLFPSGSGRDALPESESKDAIWERWEEFTAAAERLGERAAALEAAIAAGGSGGEVAEAFGALGKDGCQGCHRAFREKHTH